MLGERRAAILRLIIEYYIKTGEPIGSKTLCNLLPYAVSSATIRNEMAHLSNLGYLEQRHTSGGRVPGKNAYRFYVDHLMEPKALSPYETAKIDERLSVNAGDAQRLLADAADLLADATHCAAFSCALADAGDVIQGVQLIPAGGGRAMLVMLTAGGRIKSSICRLSCPADDGFMAAFYDVMHSTAVTLGSRIFDMLPVLSSLCALCAETRQDSLLFAGETNLLSLEELGNEVYKLLTFLTNRPRFLTLAKQFADAPARSALFIGEENPYFELKNTATMLCSLHYNSQQRAVLGVIGSTRMDYATIVPRAQYIMNKTTDLLAEGGITNG